MADNKTIASELSRIQAAKGEISNAVLTRMQVEGLGQNPSITVLSEWLNNTRKGSNGEVDPSLGLQVHTGTITLKDGLDSTITLDGYYKDVVVDVEGGNGDIQLGLPGGNSVIVPGDTAQPFSPSNDGVYGYRDFTVSAVPKHYGNVNNLIEGTDASQILQGKTAYIKTTQNGEVVAQKVTGTMVNRGTIERELETINSGAHTYTIQPGYYSGGTITLADGTVTTTDANASASEILSGKTAYVNGLKVTGTIPTQNAANITIDGANISLAQGYYPEGVSTTMDSAVIQENVEYYIDADGTIHLEFDVNKGGYIAGGSIADTIKLNAVQGKTIVPSKAQQLAVDKEFWVSGSIYVAPIPKEYQYVVNVTATSDRVLEGYTFVDKDGNEIAGTMRDKGNIDNIILSLGNSEYRFKDGENPGYYHDGSIKIVPQGKLATIGQAGYKITPDDGKVLAEVEIPSVGTYLQDKVNVAASDVLEGKSFVTADGTPMTGTMTKHEEDLHWDYTKYDKLPIPAGAYPSGGGEDIEGHGTYQHWYLPNREYLAWEQENIYYASDNGYFYLKDEWQQDIYDAFGPGRGDSGDISVYKFPIAGNGYITEMGSYGLSLTEPVGGFGDYDDQEGGITSYELFLKNGTFYIACDRGTYPEDVYAWTYEYIYTIPGGTGLYVVMDGLVEALAAI